MEEFIKLETDPSQVLSAFESIKKSIQQTATTAAESSTAIEDSFSVMKDKMKSMATMGVGALGLGNFAQQVIKVRSEFQDTESMFKVFLGDAEKAAQHVKDLQAYAFNNVFDFQQLTEASAQLISYGTEVENVTHVINQLSEVAAGTNGSLKELVDVYNRVKATDTLDSKVQQGLAARGIKVAELLAEARGLDANVVKKMTLHFEDLQEALSLVTDEGGMFYGMMEEKSKNIGDSIGYLEDNITGMFNDIGTKLQEPIHDSIYAVAELVEQYEKVGAVLAGLVTTYGSYKVACMAAIAVDKIATETKKGYTFWQQMQIQFELLLEKAINKKNAALMKNPYALVVLAIAAAIAGVIVAIKLWNKSEDENEKALNAVNKAMERRMQNANEQVSKSDELIGVLEKETSSVYELSNAYAELAAMDVFKAQGKSAAEIMGMSPEEIRKAIHDWYDEKEKAELAEEQKSIKKNYEFYAQRNREGGHKDSDDTWYTREMSRTIKEGRAAAEKEALMQIQSIESVTKSKEEQVAKIRVLAKEESDAIRAESPAYFDSVKALRQHQAAVDDIVKQIEQHPNDELTPQLTKQRVELQKLVDNDYDYIKSLTDGNYDLMMRITMLKAYNDAMKGVNNETSTTPKKHNKEYWENEKKNASNTIFEMEMGGEYDVDEYNRQLDIIKKADEELAKYKIENEFELQKQLRQAREKALLDRQKLAAEAIKAEKLKNEALRQIALAEVDEQERVWKEAHPNGRVKNPTFDMQRVNVNMEYDEKNNEYLRTTKELLLGIGRETSKLNDNAWLSNMQHQLNDLNPDLQTQLDLIKQIGDKQRDMAIADLQNQKDDLVNQRDLELQSIEKANPENKDEYIKEVNDRYAPQIANIDAKINQEREKADWETTKQINERRLQAYSDYAAEVVRIETEMNERIHNIQMDQSLTKDEKDAQIQQAKTTANLENQQAAMNIIGEEVTDATAVEIEQIVSDVMDMTLETIAKQIPDLLKQINALKKAGNDVSAQQAKLNSLTAVYNARIKQQGQDLKETKAKQKETWKAAETYMRGVLDVADSITAAFGEDMSDNAKEALNTAKTIAQSTITLIFGIQAVSQMSAEAIKSAEGASVILAIISAVVQIATAIAQALISTFSTYAQAQKQIDANQKRIDKLKNSYEELQHQQKSKVGRDYWNEQFNLIKNNDEQLKLMRQNMALAQEQMDAAATSKKKDNAEDTYNEYKKMANDIEEGTSDLLKDFYDELITTDLAGFSESLADSIVDGFAEGLDGMDEIWEDAFDNLMRDMLKKQISLDLQERLGNVWKTIQSAFSQGDTELDRSEIDAIKAEYAAAKAESEAKLQAYKDLYDELDLDDNVDINGSSGAFEGMSAEQADALDGRFAALQMIGINMDSAVRDMHLSVQSIEANGTLMLGQMQAISEGVSLGVLIAQDQLSQLETIAENTSVLAAMERRLRTIETNTGKL